jgi:CelD/BcsL family acetyltransferase involved in cellulose biosynthesis
VAVVEDLSALRDEWTILGERSGNLFGTWEWNSLWWKHFGRGRPLLTAACRDESGTLVGLLPMYVAGNVGRLRVVRTLGHGHADRLGPICCPEDRPRVAQALRLALRSKPWRNALVLAEQLPAEESWSALLGARTLAHQSSPVLELTTSDWEEFLATRSANLRQNLRRKERRLMHDHAGRYRLIEDAETLPRALDVLFELHRMRWGNDAAREFAGSEPFHRAFAARALERGWLRLWLMDADERTVAAWYGFRFGGADWLYQTGRDPAWERYSVGSVLLGHTIRSCVEAGLGRYHFLRGDEAYKSRFASDDPGLETVAIPTGAATSTALRVARKLPRATRRRAARIVGL